MDNVAATGYREIQSHFLRCWLMTDLSPLRGPRLSPGVTGAGWSVAEDIVVLG